MDSREDVQHFMIACDQIDHGFGKQSDLYMKLITEEFQELLRAYIEQDLVGIADGCADLKWVVEGLENTLRLPKQSVWNEVARSNLSKISKNGKVLKREDGKVLKPESYSPPDIKSIVTQ
jgi:predicted HAD superfamily Cof-like phosphohydrolase